MRIRVGGGSGVGRNGMKEKAQGWEADKKSKENLCSSLETPSLLFVLCALASETAP